MDFNAYNIKRLADDECERKNEEKYKDIIDAIRDAAKEGNYCVDVIDLSNECIEWLNKLEFEVYTRRRDNRWIPADEIKLYNIDEVPFPRIEKEHLYRIVW